MIEIKDLLIKFNTLLLFKESKKIHFQEVFKKITNLDINTENIEIKNNVIYLNIKPIYKNEIFLKKEKILLELKKSLGDKAPKDIK